MKKWIIIILQWLVVVVSSGIVFIVPSVSTEDTMLICLLDFVVIIMLEKIKEINS